jgi:hypothetical protein
MKSAIAIAALMLIGACDGNDRAGDSGVTAEESQALNETEDMLEEALDDGFPANSVAPQNGVEAANDVGNLGDLPVVGNAAKRD